MENSFLFPPGDWSMGLETHISLWVSRLSSEFLLTSYAELDAALSTCFLNVLSASRQVVTLSRLNQLVCFSVSWIDLTHVKLQFHLSGSLNCDLQVNKWCTGCRNAFMSRNNGSPRERLSNVNNCPSKYLYTEHYCFPKHLTQIPHFKILQLSKSSQKVSITSNRVISKHYYITCY